MALQLSIPAEATTIGIPMKEAYARIEGMEFDQHSLVTFYISYYYNEVTRRSGHIPLLRESFVMKGFNHETARSPKSQIYSHLKKLAKFEKAVDV